MDSIQKIKEAGLKLYKLPNGSVVYMNPSLGNWSGDRLVSVSDPQNLQGYSVEDITNEQASSIFGGGSSSNSSTAGLSRFIDSAYNNHLSQIAIKKDQEQQKLIPEFNNWLNSQKGTTGTVEIPEHLKGLAGDHTVHNGVFTSRRAVESELKNEQGVKDGTLRKVQVGNGWGYVPTGSAADANQVNIGTHNTATAANQQPTTTTAPTGGFSLTGGNLNVGAKGDNVKQLQSILGISADGIYGPQTLAAVKAFQTANGLTADGIVGPKTMAALNLKSGGSTPPPPTTGGVGTGVPTSGTGSPVLPQGTSGSLINSYYGSLAQSAANAQATLDAMRNQQLQQIQQDKLAAQQELDSIRSMQGDAINSQGNAALEEKQMILQKLSEQEARFNENYNIAQGLTTKLTDLMTEGNNIIAMISGKTGLAGIRNPRINQAIQGVTAAVGVIQAGLDVANGQMDVSQRQLTIATSTITSAYTDQIDYYKSLADFYESQATDASNKLTVLSRDERTYLDSKIMELENERNRIQEMSDKIQEAMIDPDTALAYATAGVTLQDTPEQIGAKLAKYGYSKELSDQSSDMAMKGYTALVSGNAPAGSEVVKITDSLGKVKTYYKKASGSGDGTGTSSATGSSSFTDIMQDEINNGSSPEAAARVAASVSEALGVSVNTAGLNTLVAEARKLTPSTPQTTTTETVAPVIGAVNGRDIEVDIANAMRVPGTSKINVQKQLERLGYTQKEIANSSASDAFYSTSSFFSNLFGG